ncbi:hypothetical protein L9F63_018941, partial [Diploptera punctata]
KLTKFRILALSLNSLLKRNNVLLKFTKDFNVLTEMPAWVPAVRTQCSARNDSQLRLPK